MGVVEATSAEGMRSQAGTSGGGRAFGHFDPRFDRQCPGIYPAWYCSQYPYGYNPAVGCYYPSYPGPAY